MATQDPSASPSNRGGWRGSGAASSRGPTVQHGWQQRGQDDPHERLRKQQLRTRNKVLLFLGLCLVLVAGLLGYLLYRPLQTPVVYLAPAGYQWPLPPTAMAREDREALQDLDYRPGDDRPTAKRGNDSLELIDTSSDWQARESGLQSFKATLDDLSRRWRHSGPIIIYVCMHGVADEADVPYLVPPGASPADPDTWLPLASLLRAMEEVSAEHPSLLSRPKLLVLDCQRMERNWSLGLLENRFVTGAKALIQASPLTNLAVLTSAGEGQRALVSEAQQASVFGLYLRRGLAGEAAGSDGWVTLRELETYLQREVQNWAETQRGAAQQPQVWTTPRTGDFRLARQISGSLPGRELAAVPKSIRQDLDRFWRSYHAMRGKQLNGQPLPPAQTAILSWHKFEHNLIWLEQLVRAGRDYEVQAEEVRQELARAEQAFAQREQQAGAPPFTFWESFDQYTQAVRPAGAHSIPLNRYFGLSADGIKALDEVALAWQAAQDAPTQEQLRETHRILSSAASEGRIPALIEDYLPGLLSEYWFELHAGRAGQIVRLLALRERAERLAAPLDPRLVPWLAPQLEPADAQRRLAEDRLFLDDEAALNERLQAAEAAIGEAEAWRDTLAEAYRLRDACWAELPYYALWFTRPAPHAMPVAGEQAEVAQQSIDLGPDAVVSALAGLIDESHALGKLLAEDEPSLGLGDLRARLQTVQSNLTVLRERFQRDCDRLLTDGVQDVRTIWDIERALALPLASDALRSRLRALQDKPAEAAPMADAAQPPEADVDTKEQAQQAHQEWLNRWTNLRTYPALALLGPQAEQMLGGLPADPELSSRARSELRLRTWLRNLPSNVQRVRRETGTGGASAAERMLRPSLPLVGLSPTLRTAAQEVLDPLHRAGVQRLLVWHGQRALRDVSRVGRQLAAEYRQAAELGQRLPDEVAGPFDQLTRDVDRFAANGLAVTVESLLLPLSDASFPITIESRQTYPLSAAAAGEPLGHAALFLRDNQRRPASGSPQGVPLPMASPTARFEVALANASASQANLDAVLMFRGFDFGRPFVPDKIGGFRVAFAPQVYDRARVTLHGQRSRRASIVFVLDCSKSMDQPLTGEDQDDRRSRMEIAKSKLQEMLLQLATQDDVRVGVYFFGHRRGWSREQANVALTQIRYAGADAEELEALQPGEDVEPVLSLGRFDPLLAERVIDKLATVTAWGQTPLYLALVKAQEAFAADDPDTDKSIVVITDGRNDQYAPPNNPLGPLPTTGVPQVEQAWQRYGARIHIVGLGLQDENVGEVEREFQRISRTTGGDYYAARNASALVSRLRGLLTKAQYDILNAQGQSAGVNEDGVRGPVELDETLEIVPPPAEPTVYTLLHGALSVPIQVQPGDAPQLRVSRDGQYIEALPFNDNGTAAEAALVRGPNGRPAPVLMRVHAPIANADERRVTFRVSVQMANLELTPRPAEAWVEVTPLAEDRTTELAPVYFFYDRDFQANQPVPVLSWDALDWPFEKARYARVRFWSKPEPTPVTDEGRILLRDLVTDPDRYSAPRELPTIAPGVRVQIAGRKTPDAYRIDVVQTHSEPNPDLGALKIVLAADPNAPPQRIERQFDRQHGLAIHSFIFPPSADGVFRRSDVAQLHLIPGRLVKDEAWQLPAGESVVVEVTSDRHTLSPGPAIAPPRLE